MEIEDCGTITKFETMPTERAYYFSAVLSSLNTWHGGPHSESKDDVIKMLNGYGGGNGYKSARIYCVMLPTRSLPA